MPLVYLFHEDQSERTFEYGLEARSMAELGESYMETWVRLTNRQILWNKIKRIVPFRHCMVCDKTFCVLRKINHWDHWWNMWYAYLRWGIPEYCSRSCSDEENSFLSKIPGGLP